MSRLTFWCFIIVRTRIEIKPLIIVAIFFSFGGVWHVLSTRARGVQTIRRPLTTRPFDSSSGSHLLNFSLISLTIWSLIFFILYSLSFIHYFPSIAFFLFFSPTSRNADEIMLLECVEQMKLTTLFVFDKRLNPKSFDIWNAWNNYERGEDRDTRYEIMIRKLCRTCGSVRPVKYRAAVTIMGTNWDEAGFCGKNLVPRRIHENRSK